MNISNKQSSTFKVRMCYRLRDSEKKFEEEIIAMLLFNLLTFYACSSNLQGEWNGTCSFEDQNNEQEMNVTTKIQRDNGYSLEGSLATTLG